MLNCKTVIILYTHYLILSTDHDTHSTGSSIIIVTSKTVDIAISLLAKTNNYYLK